MVRTLLLVGMLCLDSASSHAQISQARLADRSAADIAAFDADQDPAQDAAQDGAHDAMQDGGQDGGRDGGQHGGQSGAQDQTTLLLFRGAAATHRPHADAAGPALDRLLSQSALFARWRLSQADAERYRRIFGLQAKGEWLQADRVIAQLSSDRLMGHVKAQRLLHPSGYRASFAELRDWLDQYADHPGAQAIHRLAMRRQGRRDRPPRAPETDGALPWGNLENYNSRRPFDVVPRMRGDGMASARLAEAFDRMGQHLRNGDAMEAWNLLSSTPVTDPVMRLGAEANIAAALLYEGDAPAALRLAGPLSVEHGIPLAHWVAGLSAWRTGRLDRAVRHFEALARAREVSAWDLSAGAFWAARANLRLGRANQAMAWLQRAAGYPRTFYGLLAGRLVGMEAPFRWDVPELTSAHADALAAQPAGLRAIALLDIGERDLAEAELRRLDPAVEPLVADALLVLSVVGRMPALALRIGNAFEAPGGATWDAALYPLPPWEPQEGFVVDAALVYSLMRQESRFNPRARSPAGATGLMQLMPATADQMAGQPLRGLVMSDGPGDPLLDPALNLSLGQRYIAHLLEQPAIAGNLIVALASYNAGPTAVARWRREIGVEDDPLLFMELLPVRETRNFLERVMAALWIYRLQMGQGTACLDALASGDWPIHLPNRDGLIKVADRDGAY